MKNRMFLLMIVLAASFDAFAQKELSRLINQSYKALNKSQFELASSLSEKAIQIDSTDYRAHLFRGIMNIIRSEPQLAVNDLLKAAACENDDALVPYYLGLAYYNLEDYKTAAIYLKIAEESDYEDIDFIVDLADAYLKQGNDSCLYYFDKALAEKPKYAYAYRRKGDFYYHQGRYEECLLYYSQAIRFNKKDTDSYYSRSYAKYRLSDYQGAERDVLKAIETSEGDAEKYYFLGIYNYWDDDYPAAKQALEKSIAFDTAIWESLYYLAHIQYEENEHDKALSNINKAIGFKKDDPDLFILRGYIQYELSNPGEACLDWMIAGGLGSEEARELAVDNCGEKMAGQ